jgi:uncharacterized membrane protein
MVRYWEIDFFRGIAVIMMIIFHLLFYINYFEFIQLNLYSGFIGKFQMIIPLIFLTVSGISSSIQKIKNKRRILFRGLKLMSLALLITLITFLLFPNDFVFFGIIHLIASCIIIFYFIKNDSFALILGLIILISSYIVNHYVVNFKYLSILGFKYVNLNTFDYYPLIPWFGIFLIGTYIGSKFYLNKKAKKIGNKLINYVCFIGKHSLKIYFIHIILLFGSFWILQKILT